MKYFAKNQYGTLKIIELKQCFNSLKKTCTPLTEEQLKFLEENPGASAMEVLQGSLNKVPEPVEIPLDNYKEQVIDQISRLSLNTSREKVSDYQFLNAQASLLSDAGIYTHEKANEIIVLYNTIGKQCRDKYYAFVEELNNCNTREKVEELVDLTINFYKSL